MTCLWIATTPRSGSNYFCDQLFARARITKPRELLSPMFLQGHSPLTGAAPTAYSSFDSILEHLGYLWPDNEYPRGLKALYPQFAAVRTVPGIRDSLSAHTVVMLVRQDVIAQAVSLFIARSTGCWTSAGVPLRDLSTVEYAFAAIDARVEEIERQNALWRRTFMVSGIDYREITYEQLTAQPTEVVESVLELWQLEPRVQPKTLEKPRMPQSTDINARFIEQYRHDKAKAIFETAAPKERP